MRRVLFYSSGSNRYYYARYDESSGYLELGSSRLLASHRSFHPEEVMRLVVAGSGENSCSRTYLTPRFSLAEIQVKFDRWLSSHKHMQPQLDTIVG